MADLRIEDVPYVRHDGLTVIGEVVMKASRSPGVLSAGCGFLAAV